MPNEAGDSRLTANLRRLIDSVSADPTYNPSNAALRTTALESLYGAGMAASQDVAARMATHKLAINDRQTVFENLGGLVKRSRNILKSSGVSTKVLDDAETLVRKLTGTRKTPKAKTVADAPNTPENEAVVNHSASQMSYDNRIGNFGAYIAILQNVPEYNPNETDLKVVALNANARRLASEERRSQRGVCASQPGARGPRQSVVHGRRLHREHRLAG